MPTGEIGFDSSNFGVTNVCDVTIFTVDMEPDPCWSTLSLSSGYPHKIGPIFQIGYMKVVLCILFALGSVHTIAFSYENA